jgi:hypothetical protein
MRPMTAAAVPAWNIFKQIFAEALGRVHPRPPSLQDALLTNGVSLLQTIHIYRPINTKIEFLGLQSSDDSSTLGGVTSLR